MKSELEKDPTRLALRHLRSGELTQGELDAKALKPTNFGHVLEEEVARQMLQDRVLREHFKWTGRGNAEHDFTGQIEGKRFNLELTTSRELESHAARESVDVVTTYERQRPVTPESNK